MRRESAYYFLVCIDYIIYLGSSKGVLYNQNRYCSSRTSNVLLGESYICVNVYKEKILGGQIKYVITTISRQYSNITGKN
jgi:hypothetical protein